MEETNNIYAKSIMKEIDSFSDFEKDLYEAGMRKSLSTIHTVAVDDNYEGYTSYELMERCGNSFNLLCHYTDGKKMWVASKLMIADNPQKTSGVSTKMIACEKDNPLDAIVGLLKQLKEL